MGGTRSNGGVFVTATTPTSAEPGRGVKTVRMGVRSDAAQLAELLERAAAGRLSINVAQRRPLAELADVHAQADAGTLPGKTVIVP
jgi:NADPH:quinone reductase-like Zn-dependent oxidoreductase